MDLYQIGIGVAIVLIVKIIGDAYDNKQAWKRWEDRHKNRWQYVSMGYKPDGAAQGVKSEDDIEIFPYQKKDLLTPTEYQFYRVLKKKCAEYRNVTVCPKVRMEDFINLTTDTNTLKYRGYIRSRHVDFILCNQNMTVIAGIELDDPSHNSPDAQKTDRFKNQVFQTINVPLYRIRVEQGGYSEKIDAILEAQLPREKAN